MKIATYNILGLTGYPPEEALREIGPLGSEEHIAHFARVFTELDSDIKKSLTVTFGEDADFLAGQQANMERFPNKQMLNNTADAGVVQTRRLIERWIEADTATAEAAE